MLFSEIKEINKYIQYLKIIQHSKRLFEDPSSTDPLKTKNTQELCTKYLFLNCEGSCIFFQAYVAAA